MFPNLPNSLQFSGATVSPLDLLRLCEAEVLGVPRLLAPTPIIAAVGTLAGTATATTNYNYQITALSALGATSTVSATVTCKHVAQLSASEYVQINWSPVPDAVGYLITRTAGGSGQGVIAVITAGGQSEPAGALVPASFPMMQPIEVHDTALPVLADG